MASPAGQALLRAIEGYKGAHGGQQGHEDIMGHLDRVHKEVLSGKAKDHGDSPGRREVGIAAGQREIPSERAHDGGDGQVKSNKPSGFTPIAEGPGDPVAGGSEERKMSATGPPPSEGNRFSNKPSAAPPSGATSFRTVAAARANEAQSMRIPAKMSGGNVHSQTPGPPAENEARVGDVAAPAKAGGDRNKAALEEMPGYVAKEQLGGDKWERAAAGVRKRFASVK